MNAGGHRQTVLQHSHKESLNSTPTHVFMSHHPTQGLGFPNGNHHGFPHPFQRSWVEGVIQTKVLPKSMFPATAPWPGLNGSGTRWSFCQFLLIVYGVWASNSNLQLYFKLLNRVSMSLLTQNYHVDYITYFFGLILQINLNECTPICIYPYKKHSPLRDYGL